MSRRRRDEPREPVRARIDDLSHDGRGVARVDGKAVFIAGALPGELVDFLPVRRRHSHDRGELLAVAESSPRRVAPRCEWFERCGGCALQHLDPDAQIRAKQDTLLASLTRIGRVEPETVLEPVTESPWHYRRRARLGVRYVEKKGGLIVGFRERNHSFITPIDFCHTLERRFAELITPLRECIAGLSCARRLPQVELAGGDEAAALVFRHLEMLTDADLHRLRALAEESRMQVWLQPGGLDTVAPLAPIEPPDLRYALDAFGVGIEYSCTDFVQVNAAINRRLVSLAVEWLDPGPQDRVLDLFCGVGNFSLPLATRAGSVTGVEGAPALVERAARNAARNDLDNAVFRVADLHDERQVSERVEGPFTRVLLDPPRSGAIEAVRQLPHWGPDRVVYVSCDPATLARDANVIVNLHGYRIIAAGVVDMFPHTAHVESIAVFER